MVLPLIAAVAGRVVAGRVAASVGAEASSQAIAARAGAFGGQALARQHQNRRGPGDDIVRHPQMSAMAVGMMQKGLGSAASNSYSSMLQPGQFF